jgi:hypothetical protein
LAVTIYDPRSPDIMLWLSAMEPDEAACVMMAMRDTFPILRGNRQWAEQIEERCAGLSGRERQALAKRAGRIGKRIVDEMTEALGRRPHLR